MTRFMGVEFAPLCIPLERRLQTLGAIHHFFITLFLPVFTFLLPAYLVSACSRLHVQLFTSLYPLVLLYGLWLWRDWESPRRGGYPSKWWRSQRVHTWFARYFPVRLHASCPLPANGNYLIGSHPHGIISMSAYVNFATNGTGISDLFPDLSFHLCTLVGQFWTPLRREWGLLHGMVDCSRASIRHLLEHPDGGKACVLVVGGAEEALDAHPGHHILTLNSRKGFIRLALQTGASLVPAYSFGENEVFDQVDNPKGSVTRAVQTLLKNVLGFSPPIFHGRGVFNYTFGFLPYRKEINTVVGIPLRVERVESPSQKQVDDLHARYVHALHRLFEENKTKFGVAESTQLVIQ